VEQYFYPCSIVTVDNEQALYNSTKRVGLVQNGLYLQFIEN